MLNTATTLFGMRACIIIMVITSHAFAGDVTLVSDTWDSVCRVEVTWGKSAPDNTPVENFSDVEMDWSITKPDKLCYRRASTPDNCDSGMTQWNTRWRCAESTEAGTREFSLE